MVHSGPENPNPGKDLFFILEKAHLFPSFILEVMIHIGGNAEMTRYVQVIIRRLKVFDPALPGNANLGVSEKMDVRGGVGLQGCDDDLRDVLRIEPLGAQNILRKLLFRADNLRLGISEEFFPSLVQNGKVLRRPGVDENVLSAATYQVDDHVHFFPLVPTLHPIHLRSWDPESAGVERVDGIVHVFGPRVLVRNFCRPFRTEARNSRRPPKNTPISLPRLITRKPLSIQRTAASGEAGRNPGATPCRWHEATNASMVSRK